MRRKLIHRNGPALNQILDEAIARGKWRLVGFIEDELDKRAHDEDTRDYDEADRLAADDERYQMWRNEY